MKEKTKPQLNGWGFCVSQTGGNMLRLEPTITTHEPTLITTNLPTAR